ncbi:unknown [Fusobacterium sp. CAG:439]|nr:unknown [Fusobacterium sp. CAG:439]
MAIKVDGIESEDELRRAQAAAQAQGTSVTNYNEWAQILQEFPENGIESTGSYSGDKARMQEIQAAVEEYAAQVQEQERIQQNAPDNKETEKVQKSSETDRNQEMKATVANATSSQIMADYMKYYHLLM